MSELSENNELSISSRAEQLIRLFENEYSLDAEKALLGLGPEAIPSVIKTLETTASDWHAQRMCSILLDFGENAVAPLIQTLKTFNEKRKHAIVLLLGELNSKEAIAPIIEIFQSTDNNNIRRAAATALGRVKAKEAVEILINNLEISDIHCFVAIVVALGQIGEKSAFTPLANLLSHPDSQIRGSVIYGLELLRDHRAVDTLRKLLIQEQDSRIRFAAAQALASYDDTSGVEVLKSYLNNSDAGLRSQAANALAHLGIL